MAQVAGGAAQQGVTPIAMLAAPAFNDAFVQEGFALAPLFNLVQCIQWLSLLHMKLTHQVMQL